ncbi:MAG: cytochrome C [Deltaproteobacteria bacterium]|nr:MAG: cytochrome C [Deltaproteobacteria bacterium]
MSKVQRKRKRLFFVVVLGLFLAGIAACVSMKDTKRESENAKLPVIEGAKYVGSQACAYCHQDVVKDFSASIHGRIAAFEIKPSTEVRGCEACHGPASKHVETGNPQYIINPAKLKPVQASAICEKCHTDKETMDWRGSKHALNGVSCIKCHSIHGKKDKLAYRDKLGYRHKHMKDVLLVKPEPELCLSCHKDIMAKTNYPNHHPVKEGKMTCSDCHNPHGSQVNPLLRTDERKNELCLKCHTRYQGPFTFEHPPVVEDCTICHEPHGTVADNLLKQNEPFLCLQCHGIHFHANLRPDTGTIQSNPHGSGYTSVVPHDNSMQMVMMTRCTQCHSSIHGSDLPSLSIPGGGSRFTK